jgi:hypothetical protein
LDYFENAKTEKLRIEETEYSDVIVIEPTIENKKYSTRDHFVSKLYWSKSRGLIKFDKSGDITYERIN